MILSTSQNNDKVYSFIWAEKVYLEFVRAYRRATEIFYKTHRIHQGTVISWLSTNQEIWERFKKIIKLIEKWDKMHHFGTIADIPGHLLSTIYYALAKEFEFYDEKRAYCLDAGIKGRDN